MPTASGFQGDSVRLEVADSFDNLHDSRSFHSTVSNWSQQHCSMGRGEVSSSIYCPLNLLTVGWDRPSGSLRKIRCLLPQPNILLRCESAGQILLYIVMLIQPYLTGSSSTRQDVSWVIRRDFRIRRFIRFPFRSSLPRSRSIPSDEDHVGVTRDRNGSVGLGNSG